MSYQVDERECNGLRTALDALADTQTPAILIVWQEDADPGLVSEICRSVGLVPVIIPPGNLDWIRQGSEEGVAREINEAWVLPRCLSALVGDDRVELDESREQILSLGRKLIFVEPFEAEASLREDYPDLFAVARRNFHLELVGNDELFDNGDANRLETLRKPYPPSLTRGSVVFIRGKPHFKAPPKVPCPKGHGLLKPGRTSITFQHAPAASRDQTVEGWVCPTCGEAYVPGEIAREAHRRAFEASEVPGETS
jgi:hypothetical protein